MANHLRDTLTELQELAKSHVCVAVGFSGGKDSLTTLDLAVRHFSRVVPYFYYFVPGLKSEEAKIQIAEKRYGLNVRRYPSPSGLDALRVGLFCDEMPDLPEFPRRTLYNWIKADTGATLVLTGEKKADGIFRRRRMASRKKSMTDVIYPLKNWLKWEVLSYLKARDLPIPDAGRGDNGCMCLLDSEILHAHRHHPQDYEILRSYFPYIETVVLREAWFGKRADEKQAEPAAVRKRKGVARQ